MAVYFDNVDPFADPLEEGDDEPGLFEALYNPPLKGLINGRISPAAAAAELDDWVSSDTSQRFDELKKRNPPFTLTSDEKERELWIGDMGPRSHELASMIVATVATACTAYSPQHEVQGRFVQLLRELKALSHQVPVFTKVNPDDPESEDLVFDGTEKLWRFGDDPYYHTCAFWDKDQDLGHEYSDVETPGSEVQIRWRNFQAFMARITAADLIDCSSYCSLLNMLPSDPYYHRLEARKVGLPRRFEGDLIAGSYWLSGDEERRWFYNKCCKGGEKDSGWSLTRWRELKGQLEFIQGSERFPQKCQQLAEDLRKKMIAQEGQSQSYD